MDIRKVFRGISKKFSTDFEISAQMNHNSNKGDYRENSLREFLEKGRLPKKYGVGNGEIVGHVSNVSKQSDLILFDQFESVPLLYDEKVQVYPIDSVYGIIEVKSKLSKAKLLEGLENIKSVKELSPNDIISKRKLFAEQQFRRPKPFGIIFAFSLIGNSLESLEENLKEWEKSNSPEVWPNLIVVLGEGLIYHVSENGFNKQITSESINYSSRIIGIHYKEDSFFHFYSYLLDLCNKIELPQISIAKYLDLPQKIGKYIVGNNDRRIKWNEDGKIDREHVYRVNEKFIDKIVPWCKSNGGISEKDLLLKIFGQIPIGEVEENLRGMVYLYNPENLIGLHEVEDPISEGENNRPVVKPGLLVPYGFITVDGEVYCYPEHYVKEDDIEPIEGRTFADL